MLYAGWFGATYGALSGYREERGIWILALFWLALSSFFYVLSLYHQIADAIAGRQPLGWPLALDVSLSTAILGATIRLCASITWHNRRRFSKPA